MKAFKRAHLIRTLYDTLAEHKVKGNKFLRAVSSNLVKDVLIVDVVVSLRCNRIQQKTKNAMAWDLTVIRSVV